MQPAFHHSQLATYGEITTSQTLQMMEKFNDRELRDGSARDGQVRAGGPRDGEVGAGKARDGQVREINAEMVELTLGIVVKSLFGGDFTSEAREVGVLMMAVLEAANKRLSSAVQIPAWVPTSHNRREKRALARIRAMLRTFIEEHRAAREPKKDLLAVLLTAVDEESGAGMSDQQLRDEMMTLFLAGHETTANLLTWTWYLLSQHPDVEARLHEELQRVLGGRTPTAADLPQLPYLEMVSRETLRLYPPAPGFAREPIEDVMIGGFEVPKGSLISVNTYSLQRDARFFEEPARFNPERFARGWEERIPRYAYLPFGGGPRVCIGNGFAMMEAKLIVATVAQRWQFLLDPGQNVVAAQLVTVRPKYGIRMRLKARAGTDPGQEVTPVLRGEA